VKADDDRTRDESAMPDLHAVMIAVIPPAPATAATPIPPISTLAISTRSRPSRATPRIFQFGIKYSSEVIVGIQYGF